MKYLLSVLLMALLTVSCRRNNEHTAPPVKYGWEQFSKANSGIPDNQVNAVAVTADGKKWVGTTGGLALFYKGKWKTFTNANCPMPSDNILCLSAGENDLLWIGTDNGLATFDGTSWNVYNTANSILPVNEIMSVHHDKRKHITWAGTAQGLVQIEDGHWSLDESFTGDLILSLASGEEGELWMGTFNHFNFRGRITLYKDGLVDSWNLDHLGYESTFVYGIEVDENNQPVAALTGTSVKAVIRLEGDSWKEVHPHKDAGAVRALALEGSRVWAGGTKLDLYGNENGSVPLPVRDGLILSMVVDSDGYKWIGTSGHGLFRYK